MVLSVHSACCQAIPAPVCKAIPTLTQLNPALSQKACSARAPKILSCFPVILAARVSTGMEGNGNSTDAMS
jgi:hypothetical protein